MDEVRIEEYFVEGEVDIEAFIGLISSEDSKIITEFKFNEEFFFNGLNLLQTAIKCGNYQIIKYLITNYEFNLKELNANKENLFLSACSQPLLEFSI